MKRSGDARGAAAPVVAGYGKARQSKRVGEVDQILTDRRLFGHSWSGHVAKTGAAVPAEIRHQHSISSSGKRCSHFVPRPHVVGETVKQDDRKTLRIAALLESDGEDRRLNRALGGGDVTDLSPDALHASELTDKGAGYHPR